MDATEVFDIKAAPSINDFILRFNSPSTNSPLHFPLPCLKAALNSGNPLRIEGFCQQLCIGSESGFETGFESESSEFWKLDFIWWYTPIKEKVESFLPSYPSSLEQISNWQKVLHSESSKKVQEYLTSNLEQISQVRPV